MSYAGFNQAESVVHMLLVETQEYVNIYSTRRVAGPLFWVQGALCA